ncbi:MAG: ATP-binding protein [Cyanobacteria bacterium P01_A01_bin.3]
MVDSPQGNTVETPHGDRSALLVHSERSIYSPGCIQPHGFLVGVSLADSSILHISSNAGDYIGQTPRELLGKPIGSLLMSRQFESLCNSIDTTISARCWIAAIPIVSAKGGEARNNEEHIQFFNVWAHHQGDRILLEFEPEVPPASQATFIAQSQLSQTVVRIQMASDVRSLLEQVVVDARRYTGFDRVLAFRFDASGSGSVVAESVGDRLPSFLGLRFPAVDVPQEARELYVHCHTRYVRDVNAAEIDLLAADDTSELDLTQAILRSPDPCCIQYLKNIGVASSLTISLIKDRRLWGFISCHNTTVKSLSASTISNCTSIGQVASLQLANVVESEDRLYRWQLQSIRAKFIRASRDADTLEEALFQQGNLLLAMVGAGGAAFCVDGTIALHGITPTLEQVRELLLWLKGQTTLPSVSEDLFATHHLASLYSEAHHFADTASGLLLLWISRTRNSAILWFRPELLQTIDWAGEPTANIQAEEAQNDRNGSVNEGSGNDGSVTLHPRSSFELWKETVRLHSEPWNRSEIESAQELRNSLVNLVIAKLEELAQINRELERSNEELDSFAYAASHDLKEPLRGIHNYSTFLLEDYADQLDEGGIDRLNTLVRLTQRMDSLIDVLLQFAQIGREELKIQLVDLNDIVQQAIELVTAGRRDVNPTFSVPRSLPPIHCDPLLMERVFSNLFSNALKYTNSPDIQVEVGYLTPDEFQQQGMGQAEGESLLAPVLYIKDNGIGIRQRHLKTIFRLFKRLHAQKKYGGGTGAGLTIVKKIVERHGGRIWVTSEYGAGSTFFIADI